MVIKNILFDYAIMAAPRDTIFGMYAHMTARNDIRYIHLLSVFIKGYQRSIEVTYRYSRVPLIRQGFQWRILLTGNHISADLLLHRRFVEFADSPIFLHTEAPAVHW